MQHAETEQNNASGTGAPTAASRTVLVERAASTSLEVLDHEPIKNWQQLTLLLAAAAAHGTRDSISLISYAGCLGLSLVYFSENSL